MFGDEVAVGMHTKESLRLKINRCETEGERECVWREQIQRQVNERTNGRGITRI